MNEKLLIGTYNATGQLWYNAFAHLLADNKIQITESFNMPDFSKLKDSEIKTWIDTQDYPFKSKELEKEFKDLRMKENRLNFAGLDNRLKLAENFYEQNPFFYDRKQLFWFWNTETLCYELIDETDLINMIDKSFQYNTISSKVKGEIIEALKRTGRKNIPKDAPKHWVQFKNCVFDLVTGEKRESSPEWFFTNPIPHNLTERTETPQISHIFSEWVDNQSETLFEILAYCCLSDYPIHRLFVLIGSGSNGKSKSLELLTKFIGVLNVGSANLDKLTENNFHTTKLYKKLVCLMGETNFNVLEKTDIIKRLTGQDLIDFEFKGKQGFDDYNYAKIVIATNSLPMTTDQTDGFYRRWLIVDFPKKFTEESNIIDSVPDWEYDALASKCAVILMRLYKERKFTHDGTIEDRKEKYILSSNPISLFIKTFYEEDVNAEIPYSRFFLEYTQYLKKLKRREIGKKEFSKVVEREGYEIKHSTIKNITDTWILGLKLNQNAPNAPNARTSYSPPHMGDEYKHSAFGAFGISSLNNNNYYDIVMDLFKQEKIKKMDVNTILQKTNGKISEQELQKGNTEGRWFGYDQGFIHLI